MQAFREIKPEELSLNPFQAIGGDWMLVTAPNGESANPMTASWGGMGVLWNKPVVYVFLRPQRFTRELVDQEETFALNFLGSGYREQFGICGSKSGRDLDKMAACGFHLLREGKTPYLEEAETVLLCRKLYRQSMEAPLFLDPAIRDQHYPAQDYHFTYVGEITKVLVK